MYCSQCGNEMKEGANFCKRCGAPADKAEEPVSERERHIVRFLYTHKKRIVLFVLIGLVLCGAAVWAAIFFLGGDADAGDKKQAAAVKIASEVDLKEEYEIEDNKLILDPLHATYEDGSVQELANYEVYIDGLKYQMTEGYIDATELYDGKHLFRLEWKKSRDKYKYEKTVGTEHKKDTWGKYVDLVGMTGKEIAAAYGPLGTPEFGSLGSGNWGYAYVDVEAVSLQAAFPAGILDRPEDYSASDAVCMEMTGTLGTLFYNIEAEMSKDDLATVLGISLSDSGDGGCTGTLENGKLIYIGSGQGQGGTYTPDTTVRVTVSEEEKGTLLDRLF
ncbi:zinc-ribbon domain-containing protein [Anaerovorax odorimutans]|uniref:Zinc-ribbon domain-containing protein n=1 Tax=Anaerovorax odorimutans TaxID=109327 RepID=A0ABT1RRC1_9FIRM|nr:zinc-ribbon domain-containing protein [Anaerovorax odorimutans]MCQ4637718.1 zinc-ribbon domain-containing protein [Anaerovorax odorimutans]